jgi:hypothetical protein
MGVSCEKLITFCLESVVAGYLSEMTRSNAEMKVTSRISSSEK